MSEYYFPSCNFSAASPEAAKKILAYMKQRMEVAGCCRVEEKAYSPENTAIYFCQACRETVEKKMGNAMKTENLFVYLDRDPGFPFPSYRGLEVNVQDCWRDREHPEIFSAVRSILGKMGVRVEELPENREKSRFCGDLHMEPRKPENVELLKQYPNTHIYEMPPEAVKQLMREQVETYTCPLTVCYCNRCVKGVAAGGGKGVHLLELVTGTWKETH